MRVDVDPRVPLNASLAYAGFGFGIGYLGYDSCLDASAYTGVRFTTEGSLGTCKLAFGLQFSQDNNVLDNPSGACALKEKCFPPTAPFAVPGTVTVLFSEPFGGSPVDKLDPRTITGLQWGLALPTTGTPCSASFTVDDVTFVR